LHAGKPAGYRTTLELEYDIEAVLGGAFLGGRLVDGGLNVGGLRFQKSTGANFFSYTLSVGRTLPVLPSRDLRWINESQEKSPSRTPVAARGAPLHAARVALRALRVRPRPGWRRSRSPSRASRGRRARLGPPRGRTASPRRASQRDRSAEAAASPRAAPRPPRRRPTARWCSSTTTTASRTTYRRCVRFRRTSRVSRERLKRVSERFIHHAGPGARTRTMFATLSCFTPFIESAFRQKTFRRRVTPNAADDVSSHPSHALPSSHLPHTLYSTSAISGATTSW